MESNSDAEICDSCSADMEMEINSDAESCDSSTDTEMESNSDVENSDSSTDTEVHNMTMLLKMLKLLKQMQEMRGPQDSVGTDGTMYKCPSCCEQFVNILGREPRDRGDSVGTDDTMYKCPSCCEQFVNILAHEPRDRGELVSAGGHGSEKTPSDGSPHTPPDLAADPTPPQNPGQSLQRPVREYTADSPIKKKSSKKPSYDDCLSDYHTYIKKVRERKRKESGQADPTPPQNPGQSLKRPVKEYTVDSPIKKKSSETPSYDDCLSEYHAYIKEARERKRKKSEQADKEAATVTQLLREDGYCKSDLFFHQAKLLCTDAVHRKNFLQMTSAVGRYKYVQIALPVLEARKHWHPK